ncbi:MAG: serine/threonine-protein kinase [Persicimonas sp.]
MTTQPQTSREEDQGTEPMDAPQTLVGRVLDRRFRLERVLKRGGMGIVFEASQLTVNRPVAVKILRPTLTKKTDLVQRFSREIEVVASLTHPNIVELIDAGRDAGGLIYLAMEYVDGQTFRAALEEGSLSLPDILEVFVQTCDALMEAHACDVIHRDLKFDNIMLTRRKDARLHVKVLDFGVAKLLSTNQELTKSGQVPGTPGIIAPELIDENPPTPQSDLYSLGVLLYTALCGEPPFEGDNDLEVMRAHKLEPVPRIEERLTEPLPANLLDLTYSLLEKEPAQRPASVQRVRDRLEGLIRRLRRGGYTDPYVPGGDDYTLLSEQDTDIDNLQTLESDLWVEPARKDDPLERFIRAFFGEEPVVAPTTVVVALAFLLLSLIAAIVYLLVPDIVQILTAAQ